MKTVKDRGFYAKRFKISILMLLTAVTAVIIVSAQAPNLFASEKDFVYNSGGRRDPFVPPMEFFKPAEGQDTDIRAKIEVDYSVIHIEGIVYDPQEGSRAIINGQILQVGDEIMDLKITDIRPDGVEFQADGESKTIKLREQIIPAEEND